MGRSWSVLAVVVALTLGAAPAQLLAQEVGECPSDDPDCNDQDGGGTDDGEGVPGAPSPEPSPSPSPSTSPSPDPAPSPAPSPTPSRSRTASSDGTDADGGGSSTDPDGGAGSGSGDASGPDGGSSASTAGDDQRAGGWSAWRDTTGKTFDTFELPAPWRETGEAAYAEVAPPRPEVANPAARALPDGPRSTVAILESVGLLQGPPDAVAALLAPFPVAGPATYGAVDGAATAEHPWLLLAAIVQSQSGAPVVAVDGGSVTDVRTDDPVLGNVVVVTTGRGDRYVYAHLGVIADGLMKGTSLRAGRTLGTVGRTGSGGPAAPHLLFALQRDGTPMSPLPHLDRWLAGATVRARSFSPATRVVPAGDAGAAAGARQAVPVRHAGAARDPDAVVLPPWWPLPLAAIAWILVGRRSRRRTAARLTSLRTNPT